MPELLFLTRKFAGELSVRVTLGMIGMFSVLYLLGLVLSDSVPEWIKSFDWLFAFSRALRALPPWDFALIALAIVVFSGYFQRIFKFVLRRRNTLNLKKLSLFELEAEETPMSGAQRRLQMLARARVIGRLMLFATAIGNLTGVILALAVYGYLPSAGIILFILLTMLFYIPIAVNRWFRVFDRNDLAHQQLADDLLAGGRSPGETEIHVHTERMLIRAKLPLTRFLIIWPMLSIVFPLAIFAAAIESWMYAASGVDSALNKLLLVLMASSIRSIFQAVNILETLANLSARAIRPDALDRDEEEA
jgi:hypothetical protein